MPGFDWDDMTSTVTTNAPITVAEPEPKLEKCFSCTYEGDAVTEACDYHRLNPDPTIGVLAAPSKPATLFEADEEEAAVTLTSHPTDPAPPIVEPDDGKTIL